MTNLEKEKNKKLTLVEPKFEIQQLLHIMQRTPKRHVYERPAKGGGKWKYVTGAYIKKTLNYVFGWNWDFTIIDKGREGDMLWVHGRLTVRDSAGNSIIREQFGRQDIKMIKGTSKPLDYGNDLKGAATDCLKKCASELGIASDVYNEMEFKEIDAQDFTPQTTEELANEKEYKRVLTHIIDSQTIEQLQEVEGLIKKHGLENQYKEKMELLNA